MAGRTVGDRVGERFGNPRPKESDHFNVADATSKERVDRLNADFYGRFPFPWPAGLFLSYDDPELWRVLKNQELGFFDGSGPILPGARIWVAGCGTNQGAQTALLYPNCEVYATDVSAPSLRLAEATARSLGAHNVMFDERSINDSVDEKFDYVICTGVIHHNADPQGALQSLMSAVTPDGVLELMVYNRYHRQETTALQKAVRLLAQDHIDRDNDHQIALAERLMDGLSDSSSVLEFLRSLRGAHRSQLADSAIQPVEWSYTVASLADLASAAGAVLWLPTQNMFDIASGRSWSLHFTDTSLLERYDSMDDLDRWQLANLLLADRSPWLWFYLRHHTIPRPPRLSVQVSQAFLDAPLSPVRTTSTAYLRDEGADTPLWRTRRRDEPTGRLAGNARSLYAELRHGGRVARTSWYRDNAPGCDELTRLRLSLTTALFPFLRCTSAQ